MLIAIISLVNFARLPLMALRIIFANFRFLFAQEFQHDAILVCHRHIDLWTIIESSAIDLVRLIEILVLMIMDFHFSDFKSRSLFKQLSNQFLEEQVRIS